MVNKIDEDGFTVCSSNDVTNKQRSFLILKGISVTTINKLDKNEATAIISAIIDNESNDTWWVGGDTGSEWYK